MAPFRRTCGALTTLRILLTRKDMGFKMRKPCSFVSKVSVSIGMTGFGSGFVRLILAPARRSLRFESCSRGKIWALK
jgi:hypothetical protein